MTLLEGTLLEKLRKIAGTKVDGEREAARRAAERMLAKLAVYRRPVACESGATFVPDAVSAPSTQVSASFEKRGNLSSPS